MNAKEGLPFDDFLPPLTRLLTIAFAYIAGGLVPLSPYILASRVSSAFLLCVGVTLVALSLFWLRNSTLHWGPCSPRCLPDSRHCVLSTDLAVTASNQALGMRYGLVTKRQRTRAIPKAKPRSYTKLSICMTFLVLLPFCATKESPARSGSISRIFSIHRWPRGCWHDLQQGIGTDRELPNKGPIICGDEQKTSGSTGGKEPHCNNDSSSLIPVDKSYRD